ncbi:MAG: YeeE/YedE family protein, partial [Nitrospirae bacterium]|nr:YeeE/YedE family protein [Nitrospirota bacterium]
LPVIIGIILGGMLSALILNEFKIHIKQPIRQYAAALSGGVIMGIASRIAPACNVWHLLGGIPILALQSILFLIGLLPGAWIGSKILSRTVLRHG